MDNSLRTALEFDAEFLGKTGGCTDGGCIISKPNGMQTNGGCQCYKNYLKMQRLGHAHSRLVRAVTSHLSVPPPELTWLYSHCRAIGMACKSDSGKWEHDISLFTSLLQSEIQALKSAAPAVESAGVKPDRRVDDLSALVVRLARQLNKAAPTNTLPQIAVDYMRRNDLLCYGVRSDLRDKDEERKAIHEMVGVPLPAQGDKR